MWGSRILTAIPVLFLLMDAIMKLAKPGFVVQATIQLGYSAGVIVPLGILLLTCVVLYVLPQTSVLGAILLTGYLGGAVASHVRSGDPLFSHILFPVYVGILIWGGLYLREPRLRALVPIRNSAAQQNG
ncbi:MAG: hypothetical protein DMG65_02810 [Candidatus Angelobacter sp. Gp1-AA117]|nr:MAG: hypothetical protein DMG65_02810 [Candidatus Angelobacter sp. Gp1-AA117]